MSREAIQTPFFSSPWEPVATVELTETDSPSPEESGITFFEDPMGHSNEARRLAATMPAPISLPFDAQRRAECEAAAEGWV